MIKYLFVLLNLIGAFIFNLFFSNDVSITHNIPAKAKPGDEFTVEMTINKGTLGGFAQLRCEIPEGITVEPDQTATADFKFNDQIARFTWTSLPSDNIIKISFKVKIAATVKGNKSITAKFSYVVNSVKQSVEMTPAEITIGEQDETLTDNNEENNETTVSNNTNNNTQTTDNNQDNNSGNKEDAVNNTEQPILITAERTVVSSVKYNESFTVSVLVNKGNYKGFARFQETLPEGCAATEINSSGGTFSFIDQKVKIVWDNLPEGNSFSLSYKITLNAYSKSELTMDGIFNYVDKDEPKKILLKPSVITVVQPDAIVNNSENTTNANNTGNNTTETNPVTNNTTTNKQDDNASNNTASNNTSTNNSSNNDKQNPVTSGTSGINYKVQICATHQNVDGSYFTSLYNLNESVSVENHEGWIKYTTGKHSVYKEARDARENLRNKGVVGPFVTAYNQGMRITVQEALMSSKQQWFK